MADIPGGLRALREGSLSGLTLYRLPQEQSSAVYRLNNGVYVSHIVDFHALFIASRTCLLDTAKLLLDLRGFRPVHTIVAFIDNGDQLAAAFQRIIKSPNLAILDPEDPGTWTRVDESGDCALILNALYPGDETGYVGQWLRQAARRGTRVYEVFAIRDYRAASDAVDGQPDGPLGSVKVVSLRPAESEELPIVYLEVGNRAVLPHKGLASRDQGTSEWTRPPQIPNAIELSTEFWHNVSSLRLLDPTSRGRERRTALFYENNELMLKHPRLRRMLIALLCQLIKDTFRSRVDVIIYPAHSVGVYLAHLVAHQLTDPPVMIPLRQPQYGGPLSVELSDYASYRDIIGKKFSHRTVADANALILDDSVLTGASLFTMVGFAHRLGVRIRAAFVLFNRMPSETSSALAALNIPFTYVYRLHMLVLSSATSPDENLRRANTRFKHASRSYFGARFADDLETSESHFAEGDLWHTEEPLTVSSEALDEVLSASTSPTVSHILCNLALHPDGQSINLGTRIAALCNFIDLLEDETAYWALLSALGTASARDAGSHLAAFVTRKLIFLQAFGRLPKGVRWINRLAETCLKALAAAVDEGIGDDKTALVCDCLLALGEIAAPGVLDLMPRILEVAVTGAPEVQDGQGQEATAASAVLEITTGMRSVIGACAWALAQLALEMGPSICEGRGLRDVILPPSGLSDISLLFIDLLDPFLRRSSRLCLEVGVETWPDEERFCTNLADVAGQMMRKYLCDAPGYTCTLKTVLRLCKADTVLMYARNKHDQRYLLRAFETRSDLRPSKDLRVEHLTEAELPRALEQRMADDLFLVSASADITGLVNLFAKDLVHNWALGAPVRSKGEMKYFIVLGFSSLPASSSFQLSAYYHWLSCERLLATILPEIHSRHVASSSAWNALVQSIRPMHRLSEQDGGVVSKRRRCLTQALRSVDFGDLVRRAVHMSAEPLYRVRHIREAVTSACDKIRSEVVAVLEAGQCDTDGGLDSLGDQWPLKINANADPQFDEETFCTLHLAVLEFILYECLCNALSYFKSSISVDLNVFQQHSEDELDSLLITVSVTNDRYPGVAVDQRGTGLGACRTAAGAIGGTFQSFLDADGWRAVLELPAYVLPNALRGELYEYLN
jgi:orotate phosphoribosyltransferase